MSFATERKQLLAEAHRARNAGRVRKAIALYKRVLREHPNNVEVAVRTAPLLARRGEDFEAWQLYRTAARRLAREKRYSDCLSVYRDACRYVPHEFDAWRLRAELELKLGREEAAFATLLDGRNQFRDVRRYAQAIALLTRARSIEPWDPNVVLDLAKLYARTDQTDASHELLQGLASRCNDEVARKVRSAQWRLTLSPRYAWLWLQSCWRQLVGDPPPHRAEQHAETRAE